MEGQLDNVARTLPQVRLDPETTVGHDLARVQDVVGVEELLDLSRGPHQLRPEVVFHEFRPGDPHAVLGRQRALELPA